MIFSRGGGGYLKKNRKLGRLLLICVFLARAFFKASAYWCQWRLQKILGFVRPNLDLIKNTKGRPFAW